MDTLTLTADTRETGKKATKAVRNAGLVPCVLYGAHTEPVHFAVETLALRPLVHTNETYRVAVTVGGEDYDAILKQIDFHPVTDRPIHVDFQALTRGEALTLTVPVVLEGTAAGVLAGGQLAQPRHEVEVRCLPKDMPGSITVDVSEMQVGDSVHVSDLVVGEGVEILTDGGLTVATLVAPKTTAEDAAADEALLEAEEAEEAAEAADEDAADEA